MISKTPQSGFFRKILQIQTMFLLLFSQFGNLAFADGLWGANNGEGPMDGITVFAGDGARYTDAIFNLNNQESIILWDGVDVFGSHSNIHLQKVSMNGVIFTANTIGDPTLTNYAPKAFLTKDSQNRNYIIVGWFGQPTYNLPCSIYVQKIFVENDGTFSPQWGSNGTPLKVSPTSTDQNKITLADDYNGGTFVIWQEKQDAGSNTYTSNYLICVQHVYSDGSTQWKKPENVFVCSRDVTNTNQQFLPEVLSVKNSDNKIDLYIVWSERSEGDKEVENMWRSGGWDERNYPNPRPNDKIYLKHIRVDPGSGGRESLEKTEISGDTNVADFPLDLSGVKANTMPANYSPALLATKNGIGQDIWVVWMQRQFSDELKIETDNNGVAHQLPVKRKDNLFIRKNMTGSQQPPPTSLGTSGWYLNDDDVNSDPMVLHPRIISDSGTGAIVVWAYNSDNGTKVYAQHLDAALNKKWNDKIRVCTYERGNQNLPVVTVSDQEFIVAWEDWRFTYCQIYAQKISLDGSLVWRAEGVPIAYQYPWDCFKPSLTPVVNGGAVITWYQQKGNSPPNYIFAQRIDRPNAYVGSATADISQDGSYAVVDIQGDSFWDTRGKVTRAILATNTDVTDSSYKEIHSSYVLLKNKTNLTAYFNLAKNQPGVWRVRVVDSLGQTSVSDAIISITIPGVKTNVCYARPNPFLPGQGQTCLLFTPGSDPGQMPSAGNYKITILNLKGEIVRVLDSSSEWDGRNEKNRMCESGVYIYQIEGVGKRRQGSVTLIR